MGTYSEGMSFGYDKGFRFVVSVDELGNFNSGLKAQLNFIVCNMSKINFLDRVLS